MSLAQLVLVLVDLMLIFMRIMAFFASIPFRILRALLKPRRVPRRRALGVPQLRK